MRPRPDEGVLGEYAGPLHPSRVADVELMRPAAGVGELVGTQAPSRELRLSLRQVPEERLRVPKVVCADGVAIAVEVVPVAAVENVERERPDRVDVALAVGKQIGGQSQDRRARMSLEVAVEERELACVVAVRLFEGEAIGVAVREAEAELV